MKGIAGTGTDNRFYGLTSLESCGLDWCKLRQCSISLAPWDDIFRELLEQVERRDIAFIRA